MTQYEKDVEAVKQKGWALKFVKKQTQELCLEAVKQNGYALQYVKDQTPELCLEAVKQDGSALQFVKEQTPELFDRMLEENISIEETYINIPVGTLSEKVQVYLKLK